MQIKEKLDKLPKEEASKLNIISFCLVTPEDSSRSTIYLRDNAKSSFYNSQDIKTAGGFYKHTSLLISPDEKFN